MRDQDLAAAFQAERGLQRQNEAHQSPLDTENWQTQGARMTTDAKAILPETRSVQKANSYQLKVSASPKSTVTSLGHFSGAQIPFGR